MACNSAEEKSSNCLRQMKIYDLDFRARLSIYDKIRKVTCGKQLNPFQLAQL